MSSAAIAVGPSRVPAALRLWHLLSLDAPTVCAAWLVSLATAMHIRVPWHAVAAIFAAVWMVYATDRLLDAHAAGKRRTRLHERHHFHASNRRAFLTAIAMTGGALAALLVYDLRFSSRACLAGDVVLGLGLAAYFAVEHFAPQNLLPRWAPVKNFAMVALLGAAIASPVAALRPHSALPWIAGAAYAATCWLNCRLIAAWEHEETELPRLPVRTLNAMLFLWLVAAIFSNSLLAWLGLSACLLFWLDSRRGSLPRLALRIYADAALLAPLFLLFGRAAAHL